MVGKNKKAKEQKRKVILNTAQYWETKPRIQQGSSSLVGFFLPSSVHKTKPSPKPLSGAVPVSLSSMTGLRAGTAPEAGSSPAAGRSQPAAQTCPKGAERTAGRERAQLRGAAAVPTAALGTAATGASGEEKKIKNPSVSNKTDIEPVLSRADKRAECSAASPRRGR